MLHLKLFGPGEARLDKHRVDDFPQRQHWLLLCYLVIQQKPAIHRESLAAVFWGDQTTENSRKRLSQSLWRLRQGLQSAGVYPNAYLNSNQEYVTLTGENGITSDVTRFKDAVAQCRARQGQSLNRDEAALLSHAVSLYGGDLLEGVYADWCISERERMRLQYLETLQKLVDYHEMHESHEQGLIYGRRILRMDNTREKVHRRMMRLYAYLGDRSGAIAQYEQCVIILREELNVAPLAETSALFKDIIEGRLNAAPFKKSEPDAGSTVVLVVSSDETTIQHTLDKLSELRRLMAKTSAEIEQIENLLHRQLTNSS